MNSAEMRDIEGRVSVVIPTVNLDTHLIEAIESVDADGWPNVEILVVVDGQMPAMIPSSFTGPNRRILATGQRSGAPTALNIGIARATGKYLARLDADDLTLPGRFKRQVSVLETFPNVTVAAGNADLIDSQGNIIGRFHRHMASNPRKELTTTNPVVHSSVMMRTADLRRLGGYDKTLWRMQDYDLFLRAATIGDIWLDERPICRYRIHDGQHSRVGRNIIKTLLKICRRRRELARLVSRPLTVQAVSDLFYCTAQLTRYAGLRRPRYMANTQ